MCTSQALVYSLIPSIRWGGNPGGSGITITSLWTIWVLPLIVWFDKLWVGSQNFVPSQSQLSPIVQTLTNYPNFVIQSLCNLCPMPVQVQFLSSKSTNSVKCLSRLCPSSKVWIKIGHSGPEYVQTGQRQSFDNWTENGLRLDKVWTSCPMFV